MEAVKAFTFELYSIMEMKPPISKAKMTAITRNAIKAIKLYKHVVQCVEKFIQKCKPEYKIPGLYVIDSIVRQSRHQFGNDKDVFAPRFARNLKMTFTHLFACPEEDKSKVIRVLNLWQKNAVFTTDVIQPIFDLASNPDFGEHSQTNTMSSMDNSPKISVKTDLYKSHENTPVKEDNMSKSFDALQSQTSENDNKPIDPAILEHIQAIQSLLKKQPGHHVSTSPQVKKSDGMKLFDKKILDYDYGDDEEEMLNQSPDFQPQQHTAIEGLDSLLSNPEVLRTLRNVEGLMSTQSKQQAELDKIKEMRKEAEFDKHLAQTVQNLPFAAQCELKPAPMVPQAVNINPYISQMFNTQVAAMQQQSMMALESHHKSLPQITTYDDPNQSKPEVIDLDRIASPPHNKRDSKRDSYSNNSSRKRSPRKSSRDRQREREQDRERDRLRRKKYLPPFKKNCLAVVSTTLWVGHLSKLIHQDDLYALFQPIGDIVSLNLISPRGCAFLCMNRRQDAARILSKFQGERLQGKPMTIAWAPGQAMKEKEWKDYWEMDDGVSYIPWEKLNKDVDYDELEVGGMLDEETMPEWMKTHLKDLRTSKKNEKKEEKSIEGTQQSLNSSNFIDQQGLQSPSVQMQMSPVQTSQPNQINFNMPQTMSMPNPFGINPRLINPIMNPMMTGTMTPMSMAHPSMMMMNRMPSPFGPPPNMPMMGNPPQMTLTNDAQKSLGVPPDMMMSFPFGMNLPSQAAAISSAQSMMGINPPTVTSGTSTALTLTQNTSHKDNLSSANPPNQLDPSTIMQFNLPPPPALPNLSDFSQNSNISNMGSEKYDPNMVGNSDQEDSKDMDRNNERDDRNRGRDNRNRSRDSRERNDRFKDRDNKNDRGRRDDLSQRLDPRSRLKGPEQRERKSSRWGDKVNEEVHLDNPNKTERITVKEGLGFGQTPNLAQIDNVKDILLQNNSLHQILEHVIQDNMGNPPFQSTGVFGPNGPLPNQMFNMPPQGFSQGLGQDGPRPPPIDNGNMRGRGGWNRGGRGGFRGRGGYNNGPNWDNNSGPNWDNNSGPNWDNNAPVWQNQNMNRGNMMGRGNMRPPLMQNVMGRGRDNWIDNNSSGSRGGRDSDTWGGRGRDIDKWGGRGGNRDSDGWGGRGTRQSSWRGSGNRRRNDEWESPNQKRWRRDDNPEWDDQQKVWPREAIIEEEEWNNNKQGSQWSAGKKDEGNYSKFKGRENNEERPRRPSKWGDRDSDDKVKEDRWGRKSVDHTLSKDESITQEEDLHQTSAPMDLENYEGEPIDNIEHGGEQVQETTSNSTNDLNKPEEFPREEQRQEMLQTHDSGNFNATTFNQNDESLKQNVTEQQQHEHQQHEHQQHEHQQHEHQQQEHQHFENYQNDYVSNSQQLPQSNIDEVQQNSESRPHDNFESQSVEEKKQEYISHNDYQEDSHDDYNSKQEFETRRNGREFEQNQQFEPGFNDNTAFDDKSSNYDRSHEDKSLHNFNGQEQQPINDFVSEPVETNQGRYTEEKPLEPPQSNFYFGTDSESSLNKPVAMEVQHDQHAIHLTEDTGIASVDVNESQDVEMTEPNQS